MTQTVLYYIFNTQTDSRMKYECYAKFKDLNGLIFEKQWIDTQSNTLEEAQDNIFSWPYKVIDYTIEEAAEWMI